MLKRESVSRRPQIDGVGNMKKKRKEETADDGGDGKNEAVLFTAGDIPPYYNSWAENPRACGCSPILCNRFCCNSGKCTLGCDCLCIEDDRNNCPRFIQHIEKTDGFDIKIPRTIKPLFPLNKINPSNEVTSGCIFALKIYNKMHNTDYKFVKLVNGYRRGVFGVWLSYLTFLAKHESEEDKFQLFQAKLLETHEALFDLLPPGRNDRTEVLLCRKKRTYQLRDMGVDDTGDAYDYDVEPNDGRCNMVTRGVREVYDLDKMYAVVDYERPVIFLKDVLMGILDKVRNDDILTKTHFKFGELLDKRCDCRSQKPGAPLSICTGCNSSCTCGCDCGKDDYTDRTQIEIDYAKNIEVSGGYDIDVEYDGPLRTIVPRPLDCNNAEDLDFMLNLTVLAIKRYNLVKDVKATRDVWHVSTTKPKPPEPREDGYYKCKSFIKANVVSMDDYSLYYITFTASTGYPNAKPEHFQAKVLDCPRGNGGRIREVFLCRRLD